MSIFELLTAFYAPRCVLFLMARPPPRPTLFPYTTLFRSLEDLVQRQRLNVVENVDRDGLAFEVLRLLDGRIRQDRKSTRLNSSHVEMSYAVFCLKQKICFGAPSS